MRKSKAELGELERQVMQIVWSQGPLSAEAVRERVDRGLKEATVRTVLRRLEEKGYVTHRVDNRTFIYSAEEARSRVAADAVRRTDGHVRGRFAAGAAAVVAAGAVVGEELLAATGGCWSRLVARTRAAATGGEHGEHDGDG